MTIGLQLSSHVAPPKMARTMAAILFALLNCLELNNASRPKDLSPIILMPGYGGSKLEARWDESVQSAGSGACERSTEWHTIWVDYSVVLPGRLECLIEMMELLYDPATGLTHNKPGLEVRLKEPGNIGSIEYLTDHTLLGFEYFHTLVQHLVDGFGYKRNVNIRGAPYDFRRAPNELEDYYKRLKFMVDDMYHSQADGKGLPVTLICHSMGCLNALYFLHLQDEEWKRKHIRRLITLAAPWAGSVSALRIISLGYDLTKLNFPRIDPMLISRISRSFPATYFLFPNKEVFQEQPLIVTNSENPAYEQSTFYSANDYHKLLDKVDHKHGLRIWEQTSKLLNLTAPGVDTYCFYGTGQKTLTRIRFTDDFPWSEEIQHYEDGDGTVTVQSASFCRKWTLQQRQPVSVRGFETSHMGLLKHGTMFRHIMAILSTD